MSKKIIISGRERTANPYISFLMSLFITGAGEIYSGFTQRGVILFLIRAASALAVPFYSVTNAKSTYINEISFSILFFLLLTIISPVNAFIISLKRKRLVITGFNSGRFIIFFAVINMAVTLASVLIFFASFSIRIINSEFPPVIENGDILVIKKIGNSFYNKGEMIILNGGDLSVGRISGEPGESISYGKGRLSVQGSELHQSIFTDNELKLFSLTDLNVISESDGYHSYPVIQNRENFKMDIQLKKDEYFSVPDDRNDVAGFMIIKNRNISGRVEGIIFSLKRMRFLIKPFLVSG